ncbi:porin [Bradyrhizobium sp. SSUT77]|uniref:porin n=1 Tax=Bradyrhizobium sp. SSUT77 TaxID=3040603 RepID=UPI002449C2EC|nr:porin [Bradyrhizobium sp. SSUT77]MDH2348400.1 porin [Bradyrhizobium sp. SSUT77]
MKLTTQLRQHWLSGGARLDHHKTELGSIARYALIGAAISAIGLATVPAKADDLSELKAEIRALNKRLSDMEEQKTKVKALNDRLKQVEKKEEARAEAPPPAAGPIPTKAGPWESFKTGQPVHIIETQNTDVLLYGVIEPTLGYVTNVDKAGRSTVGLNTSWFSGNRWGIFITQKVFPEYGFNLLARMESEFELPSGNMDTPGVLFNRDAWVGFESPTIGKFSVGRQNTLPRDVANIWADPYGASALSTNEGGFTNVNNFKQLIFYTSGGNGAGGQGDTRYDQGLVWKKVFDNGLYLGAAYNFSDGNGPGGPNGSGPIPGAGLDKGSSAAVAAGYNAGQFHVSGFYTESNVLEIPTIGTTNVGHTHQSWGLGGNWDGGLLRLNAGYIRYTADQGAILGTRNDDVVTVSAKVTPSKLYDVEVGWQDFFAHNAAISAAGYTLVPFKDATGAVATGTGTRMTTYASFIYHPIPNIDVYIAGDHLKTSGGYSASQAHLHDSADEVVTGVRYKW